MIAYRLRRAEEEEEAKERLANLREAIANRANGANGNASEPKPLREILQVLPKPEPTSFKRKAW
jgi:hypothetical protein